MKRIAKKNQLIIAALAVMIAAAGYLYYSGRIFGDSDQTAETSSELASQNFWTFQKKILQVPVEILKARTAMWKGHQERQF